jgi:ubiquitin C-terminal hydrolase
MLSIHRISWKFSVIVINSPTQMKVRIVLLIDVLFYNWIPFQLIKYLCCQTSENAHKYIMALKGCLLRELEPGQMDLNRTALNHPYDKALHTSMQRFWDLFSSGVTTQTMTCSECNYVTTQTCQFSELILKFPQQPSAVPIRSCMLASLYQHFTSGVIDDFECLSCNRCTSATRQE